VQKHDRWHMWACKGMNPGALGLQNYDRWLMWVHAKAQFLVDVGVQEHDCWLMWICKSMTSGRCAGAADKIAVLLACAVAGPGRLPVA
jgi:hypothetical protein